MKQTMLNSIFLIFQMLVARAVLAQTTVTTSAPAPSRLTFCNVMPPIYGRTVTLTFGTDTSPAVAYGSCILMTVSSPQSFISASTVDGVTRSFFSRSLCPMSAWGLNIFIAYFDDVTTQLPHVIYPVPASLPQCSVGPNYTPSTKMFRFQIGNFINGIGSSTLMLDLLSSTGRVLYFGNLTGSTQDLLNNNATIDDVAPAPGVGPHIQARLSTDPTNVLVDDPASPLNENEKSIMPGQTVMVMFAGIKGDTQYPPRVFYSTLYGGLNVSGAKTRMSVSVSWVMMATIVAIVAMIG